MSPSKLILIVSAFLATVAPLIFSELQSKSDETSRFPGWPSEYEGKPLTQLELTDKEEVFVKGFPGKIGRFSDGVREMIIRWVERPTRKLHPASDCFKGNGYYITHQPIQVNEYGVEMGCFTASKDSKRLIVCEYIEARDGKGWSDISAWYWGALLKQSSKGWMSYVIAEKG
ncbi:MAG: hypothetical protein PVI97_02940 [Candidatus Thiodiazotropha sp.]|jgi:hypothetical protein